MKRKSLVHYFIESWRSGLSVLRYHRRHIRFGAPMIVRRKLGQGLRRLYLSKSWRATFARFAIVGGCMALIDIAVLYLLKDRAFFNVYTARVVSYSAGLTVGYLLNRYFTFHHLDSGRVLLHELARFFAVHWIGGAINYAVFFLVVRAGADAGLTPLWETAWPLVAVVVGGILGMCFNFFWARRVVFGS